MSGSQRQTALGTLKTLEVISTSEFVFLNLQPDVSSIVVSVHGVVEVIRRLTDAVISGELTEDEFTLRDRSAELLKLNEERYFTSWAPRTFSLSGTHLEYSSNKKDMKRQGLNLTPECFCLESNLKDARSKHVITLVTRHKVLHLACPTFGEKLCWVSALARAILVPRKRSLGLSVTSLFKGSLGEVKPLDDIPREVYEKINSDEILDMEQVKWSPSVRKKGVKKFAVLQKHFLRFYRDRSAFEHGTRPVGYMVFDHSARVLKRTELALEIRLESDPSLPATILEFPSSQRRKEFGTALECVVKVLKARLSTYLAYYTAKSDAQGKPKQELPTSTEETPVKPMLVLPEKATETTMSPREPIIEPKVPPQTIQAVQEKTDEERDDRPLIELRARWLDANGVLGESDTLLASIRLGLEVCLAVARDEMFTQLPLEAIPPRFSFLRAPDALISQLLPNAGTAVVTTDLEGEMLVKDCLHGGNSLLLSCSKELVQQSEDWDKERRAYKQIIMHLEAQLAEARRLLSEKARLLKRSAEQDSELRSHLFQALSVLQRDGFLEPDVDLEALEHSYLCVFAEEDALRAFAFSPNCPLRPVWRKLCAEPKRMRQYIEDLERHVLQPFGIRKDRLSAPFWSSKVLRDARFVKDSSAFAAWAKEEPWCEDDAERYVYLTSKLFYKSSTDEEFRILTKPIPTEPPPVKDTQRGVEAMKESFAKQRPASFMATPDALEAMRRFQERKSKSSSSVAAPIPPTKPVAAGMEASTESSSQNAPGSAAPSKSLSETVVSPVVETPPSVQSEDVESVAQQSSTEAVRKPRDSDGKDDARTAKIVPPVPVRKTLPTRASSSSPPTPTRHDETIGGGEGSVDLAAVSKPAQATDGTAPALPPNKPGDGSFRDRPKLPPGKPRRASELENMTDEDLRSLLGNPHASTKTATRGELLQAATALLKQDEELL